MTGTIRAAEADGRAARAGRSAAVFGPPRGVALLHSLLESAKPAGVELRGYLREATLRAVRNPGTATFAPDLKSSESSKVTGS